MDKKGYKITLSDEEKAFLEKIIAEEGFPSKAITRAKILLACHEKGNGQGVLLNEIAQSHGVSRTTVQNIRADFKEGGLDYVIYNKKCISTGFQKPKQLDGVMDFVMEMIKEEPPEGKKRWTVRLLCSECERRGHVEHIAVGKMFNLLKKYEITL